MRAAYKPGAQLRDLGIRLPDLWASDRFSMAQRKQLLHCLIRRVILTRPLAERVDMTIVWVSGAGTLRHAWFRLVAVPRTP